MPSQVATDTSEDTQVNGHEERVDPDKTVLMAYTGPKIPSRAFSRLQKSISFDQELAEKTAPIRKS